MKLFQEWCLGFVFDADFSSVVVIKKENRLHSGKWNGVGGAIDPGETPLAAMIREYAEEANGYTIDNWTLTGFLEDSSGMWKVHVFAGIDNDCVDAVDVNQLINTNDSGASPVLLESIEDLPLAPHVPTLLQLCISKLRFPETPIFSLRMALATPQYMKQLAYDKMDPYRWGAAHVLGIPLTEVTREQRSRFKEAHVGIWTLQAPEKIFDVLDQKRSEILGTPRVELEIE